MITKEMITVQILKKDREYLERLRDKKNKVGVWAVVESITDMIKRLKLEEELK